MSEFERKELEDKIFCAKCGSLVEESLLLACEHNLCLNCAARNLKREETKKIHKIKSVVCDLCLTVTPLDPSTVHELSQLLLPMESPKISSNLTSSDNLLNLTTYSSKVNLSRREICKDHGEEVSYYCLDCQCRCICTECVVHGVHKTHEVLNVKRAYPHVFEKTEDLLQTVHHKIGEINNVQFSLDNKKRELCDNTNSLKNQLANIFEDIRAKLQKKEKEIFEKAELFLQEHLQELNTYSRVLQSRVLSLNKLVDGINSHMTRNDEVSLLNFYSENKDRIGQNIKADIPEIPDFDTIYNLKVNVNQNSLESLLNSLNTVHMEISSMKGFEINKIQATQKFALKRDLYGSKDNTSNLKMGNFSKNMNSLANVSNFTPQNSSYEYSKNNLNVSFKSLTSHNDDSTERYRNKKN